MLPTLGVFCIKKPIKSKQLGVRIPTPAVWEGFRKFVNESRGRLHTKLGEEVEEALKCYMTHYEYDWMEAVGYDVSMGGINDEDYGPHIHKLPTQDRKVYKKLVDTYEVGAVVNMTFIKKIMIEVAGWTHKQTHEQHVDVLIAHNCLKFLGDGDYEIVGETMGINKEIPMEGVL